MSQCTSINAIHGVVGGTYHCWCLWQHSQTIYSIPHQPQTPKYIHKKPYGYAEQNLHSVSNISNPNKM